MSQKKTKKQHAWEWGKIIFALLTASAAAFGFFESRNVRITSEKESAALFKKMKEDVVLNAENTEDANRSIAGLMAKVDFLEKALIATLQQPHMPSWGMSSESGQRALEAAAGEEAPASVKPPVAKKPSPTPSNTKGLVNEYERKGEPLLE